MEQVMNYQKDEKEDRIKDIINNIKNIAARHKDIDTTIDSINPSSNISIYDGQPCIVINQEGYTEHTITPHARAQLLTKLGIPSPYLNRCSLKLQLHNLFYWIEEHREKKIKIRLIGEQIRAVLSQRFSTECDNIHLLPKIFEVVDELAEAEPNVYTPSRDKIDTSMSDDIMAMRIPYESMTTELPNGQIIQAGIMVTNSETGRATASVAPVITTSYSNRYYIDNNKDGVTAIRHIGDANPERVAKGVHKALEAAQVGIAALVHAYHNPIENIPRELEIIQKKYDAIPAGCISAVIEILRDVPTISQLELANHLLSILQELPLFQALLAEKQVGDYLGVFNDIDTRLSVIMDELTEAE